MMSGKKKVDYKKVMKKIKELMSDLPVVKLVVADFESVIWREILGVFPDVDIQGCLFHWFRAQRQKMGELGLIKTFNKKNSVNVYCRKLMALPFPPHEQIPGTFYELKALANDHPLEQLCDNVRRQWITSNFYQPKRWSIFSKEIRTNNDTEGWHRRLNNHEKKRANTILSFGETVAQGGVICQTTDKIGVRGKDDFANKLLLIPLLVPM